MIVVDVETTGIFPEKHSIVSIGALEFENPFNEFYIECRIWEGAEMTDFALNLNGFTRREITSPSRLSLEEAMDSFIKWAGDFRDITLAGENISFDRDFLSNSAKRFGKLFHVKRLNDLHSLSYSHHLMSGICPLLKDRQSALSADNTFLYVGLTAEPKPHNALTGAKMEAEAFSRLIYGKNLLPEFFDFTIPDYLKK